MHDLTKKEWLELHATQDCVDLAPAKHGRNRMTIIFHGRVHWATVHYDHEVEVGTKV
jgi:hypothetical protein